MECKTNNYKYYFIITFIFLVIIILIISFVIARVNTKHVKSLTTVTTKQLTDPNQTTYGEINYDGQPTGFINRFSGFENSNLTSNAEGLTTQATCEANNGFWSTEFLKCACYAPFYGPTCQSQLYSKDYYKIYAKIYYDDGTLFDNTVNPPVGVYPGIETVATGSMQSYPYLGRYTWYTVTPSGAFVPANGRTTLSPTAYATQNADVKGIYIINNTFCYMLRGIYIIELLTKETENYENYVLLIKKTAQYDFAIKDKIFAIPEPEYTGMFFLPKPYFEYQNSEIDCNLDIFKNALDPIATVQKSLSDEITTNQKPCFFPNPVILLNGKLQKHNGLQCPISTSQYPFGISDVYQCKYLNNNTKNNYPINDEYGNVSWLYTKPTKTCVRNSDTVQCNNEGVKCQATECIDSQLDVVTWNDIQTCSDKIDNACWPRPNEIFTGPVGAAKWQCINEPCCKSGDLIRTKTNCLYCLQTYVTSIYNQNNPDENFNVRTCRDLMPRSNVSYFYKFNEKLNALDINYFKWLNETEKSRIKNNIWQVQTFTRRLEDAVKQCCRQTDRLEEIGTAPVSTINPAVLYYANLSNSGFQQYQTIPTRENGDYSGGYNPPLDFENNKYKGEYTTYGTTVDSIQTQVNRQFVTMSLNNAYSNSTYAGDINYFYIVNTLANTNDNNLKGKATYDTTKLDTYRMFGNMYFKNKLGFWEPYQLSQSYYDYNEYNLGYDSIYTNEFRPRGLDTYSTSVKNYFETFYSSVFYDNNQKMPSSIKIKLPEYTYVVNTTSKFNMDPLASKNVNLKYPVIYTDAMASDSGFDKYFVDDMVFNLKFPPISPYYQSINFTIPCSTRCSYPYVFSSCISNNHAYNYTQQQNCCENTNRSIYSDQNKSNPDRVCNKRQNC